MSCSLVAPVAGLLQTAEVVAECGEDGRAVAALDVTNESVRTNEAVARIFGNRADDPAKHPIINRTRAQLDQTFRGEVVDLRRAGCPAAAG